MKLYLVWNEAKTECVGFLSKEQANYAAYGGFNWNNGSMEFSHIGDAWINVYGEEECTIQEIEV